MKTAPDPRTGEKEVDGVGIQGHPQLHSKVSLGYMRPRLTGRKEKGKRKRKKERKKKKSQQDDLARKGT